MQRTRPASFLRGEEDGEDGSGRNLAAATATLLDLYERISEPYPIGLVHRQLARLTFDETARHAHVSATRAVWLSIGREALFEKLDAESGAG